jgi:hypothetical protein
VSTSLSTSQQNSPFQSTSLLHKTPLKFPSSSQDSSQLSLFSNFSFLPQKKIANKFLQECDKREKIKKGQGLKELITCFLSIFVFAGWRRERINREKYGKC